MLDNSKPIGQALLELGLITRDQLDVALSLQQKRKETLGELLVSLRFVSEEDMLKFLSSRLQTRYITAERLARIRIAPNVLNMLPVSFAEQYQVLPILHDPDRNVLSVLMSQPQSTELVTLIARQAGAASVNGYLALRPTILAGIRKFYRGDTLAFSSVKGVALDAPAPQAQDNLPALEVEQAAEISRSTASIRPAASYGGPGTRPASSPNNPSLNRARSETAAVGDAGYIETINALVGLMELKPENMRGHSASVARFTKLLSEKLGVTGRDVFAGIVAAYFHDLGKKEHPHTTWINLTGEADIKRAKKLAGAPGRLFENAGLPPQTIAILDHLFERYDGKGFPDGLAGADIPLGSRIIALVDAYEELARNPAHNIRNLDEAVVMLRGMTGTHFDPEVFRIFEGVLNDMRKKPRVDARTGTGVLVVDANTNDAGTTDTKLTEAGYRVVRAAGPEEALTKLQSGAIAMVISEIAFGAGINGIDFCRQVKANPAYKAVPFIFVSRDDGSDTINTAFDAGADEFLSKPYRAEMLIAKVRRLLMRAPPDAGPAAANQEVRPVGGMSGSLKEVSLPDLLQLFSQGRKTGVLSVDGAGETGQIFLDNGDVINAEHRGITGEKAFYALVRIEEGHFVLRGDVPMPPREIQAPVQHLIMEGLRLWDEERAGKKV